MKEIIKPIIRVATTFIFIWVIFYIPHYFNLDIAGSWYGFPYTSTTIMIIVASIIWSIASVITYLEDK